MFTKVPINRTVYIIKEQAFSHPLTPPSYSPEEEIRNKMLIFNSKTPFTFAKLIFIQVHEVFDGSSLGQTFVDLYMVHVESLILNQNRASNPHNYMRYVDFFLCLQHSRGI